MARKRRLYARIYRALRPGGVFVNADVAISAHPVAREETYRRGVTHLGSRGIDEQRAYAQCDAWATEDTYCPVDDELTAMRDATFQAECLWQEALSHLATSAPNCPGHPTATHRAPATCPIAAAGRVPQRTCTHGGRAPGCAALTLMPVSAESAHGFGRAVRVECRRQIGGDALRLLILDLVTLHHIDDLAATQQGEPPAMTADTP